MKKILCLIFSFYFLFFTFSSAFAEESISSKSKGTKTSKEVQSKKNEEKKEQKDKNKSKVKETPESEKKSKTTKSTTKKEKTKDKSEKKDEEVSRKISINSAQYTEYKKIPSSPYTEKELKELKKFKDIKEKDIKELEKEKDELIVFTGMVSISVSDGASVSTIKADQIIHNKTRETLTAIGNVFYERKVGSSSGESFSGEYLIFNIEKLEGVFLNGVIEQATTKKGREPFRVHTDTAGRNESGTIAFKNALLTTSKEDDPLWSIRASRIWILPGNEMAFANGFLSVGVVPLIYLPFFYYPADEMLFHPVFGFRNREGAFIQTTTYLYGRKPAPKSGDSTSFSNFMLSDTLKKQKLEGLFFKKLDEPVSGINSSHLKLLADAYSGLGYFVGLDGKFSLRKTWIRSINFYSYFGFSNTLYPVENEDEKIKTKKYSMFDDDGVINKNSSNFFGKKVPFRYKFNFGMRIRKSPFNLSLNFPFISDPFFKQDFLARSEDMNWFKYLLDKDKLAEAKGPGLESRYSWKVDSSLRPNIKVLKPWINSINIDKLSGKLNFENKVNESLIGQEKKYSPEREFFHPKNLAPECKLSLRGSIFSTSMLKRKSKQKARVNLYGIQNPFNEKFADLLKTSLESEKESENNKLAKDNKKENKAPEQTEQKDKKAKNEKKNSKEKNNQDDFTKVFIPLYKIKSIKTHKWSNFIDYNLTYNLDGTADNDLTFDYKEWKKPEDINWNKFYSNFYKLYGTAGLNSNFSFDKGFLTINNSFDLKANYQKHTKIKDESKKENLFLNNSKKNIYTLTNTNSIKLMPFLFSKMFKPIYAEWKISEDIIKNKFDGTYEKPKWSTEKLKWDKDYIKTHSLSTGLGIVFYDYTQMLTSSMNLSPLLQAYSWVGNFTWPYTKFNVSVKYFQKEINSPKKTSTSGTTTSSKTQKLEKEKKWEWSPFNASLNFAFPYNISLGQSYSYNIEDKKHDKYSISCAWKSISASYSMSRQVPYKLEPIKGWVPESKEKKFIPQSFSVSASNSAFPIEFYFWKNRINLKFNFNSKLDFNLIRVTDSSFSFGTSFSFKIHEFWNISFSSLSQNKSIAKYFQGFLNLPIELPGEKNIIKDLASSFYFWDEAARRRSSFNLKSLNFSLTHYLKDWEMKLTYSLKPVLRNEAKPKHYDMVSTVTFVVEWKPIGDIKVQAKEEDKKFKVDRGEIK